MADPLMDLVDGIVSAVSAETFSSTLTTQWKDDALAELEDSDLLTAQLWVVDVGESLLPAYNSNAQQHGAPIEEFEVLLVLQRKFADDDVLPTECRAMSTLAAEVTRFLRKTVIEDAVCVQTVRTPARNLQDYNNLRRFYAEIKTTWHRVYEDDE